MTKKNDFSSDSLEQKVDLLIKRFEEQKGIIDSYIERERDWKKSKVLHNKEIKDLKKTIKKLRSVK
ncbi:MAG: hypothetical protein CBE38_04690 [Gammaproteobacteria bacterium TMED278]|jgi:hypothetical protein|nr:hypothetical protein [Gammaproteobacteria bacterium]OUX41535.1 MAG: hypothetical protein CBE38_04690 [Gammaproteobacteria bacterium TMED278]RCL36258.1 MAG: hypothetical protein DBW99_01820 [SAR86 cluster bacterium]URQ69648.1 hypothetical protein M9C80_00365 [SAR86 cluster bacterium]|tara:strand:- start:703 stop:900 length:198 start_codon:yes stop_codon:yes gene_type:complete